MPEVPWLVDQAIDCRVNAAGWLSYSGFWLGVCLLSAFTPFSSRPTFSILRFFRSFQPTFVCTKDTNSHLQRTIEPMQTSLGQILVKCVQ